MVMMSGMYLPCEFAPKVGVIAGTERGVAFTAVGRETILLMLKTFTGRIEF